MHYIGLHDESNTSLPYAPMLTKYLWKYNGKISDEIYLDGSIDDCEINSNILNKNMGVLFKKFENVITYVKNSETSSPHHHQYENKWSFHLRCYQYSECSI